MYTAYNLCEKYITLKKELEARIDEHVKNSKKNIFHKLSNERMCFNDVVKRLVNRSKFLSRKPKHLNLIGRE